MKRAPKKMSFKQEKLLHELDYIGMTSKAKSEISRFIRTDRAPPGLITRLREQDFYKWPKALTRFLRRKLYEYDRDNFNYEAEWDEKDAQKEAAQDEEKEQIFMDFKAAAKRVNLDSQIQYDIVQLMDDPKRDKVRSETLTWLDGFLDGAVPRFWSDKVVKFLKERRKEIFQ
jgi:hypothetical protein